MLDEEPTVALRGRLAAGPRWTGRRLADHPRPTLIGAAVLAVASVVLAVLVWVGGDDGSGAEDLQEARSAAQLSAVRLLSYGQATLDEDLEAARAVTTGGLRDSFDTALAAPVREEFAATPGLESRITVAAAGAFRTENGDTRVLVLYNQINRVPDVDQAQTIRLAALLTMQKTGGEWRVSNLTQF